MITLTPIQNYHMFLFVCLLRSRKTVAFLQWFPHFNIVFANCKVKYDELVKTIHASYLQKYVKREGMNEKPNPNPNLNLNLNQMVYFHGNIYNKYDWHIKEIHRLHYIPSVKKGNKKPITTTCVRKYLSTISPIQIMKLL